MTEFWDPFVQLLTQLGILVGLLLQLVFRWSLVIAWVAWWLWGVNWKKVWPVLAQGAWVPVVLVSVVVAFVWSQVEPSSCTCLGFVTVPNFWWQLGGVSLLVAVAFFCGWLQDIFGWTPAEIDLEPPATPAHDSTHH